MAATYAFLEITFGIINLIKDCNRKDVVFITICNVDFIDALVSILSLTVTLLTTFGADRDYSLMITLVGIGVSLIIIFIGVFMLFDSRKILNKAEESENNME